MPGPRLSRFPIRLFFNGLKSVVTISTEARLLQSLFCTGDPITNSLPSPRPTGSSGRASFISGFAQSGLSPIVNLGLYLVRRLALVKNQFKYFTVLGEGCQMKKYNWISEIIIIAIDR
jgi:hypothetical protein